MTATVRCILTLLGLLSTSVPAHAIIDRLGSTYTLQTTTETELTELETVIMVTGSTDAHRFVLFNVRAQNTNAQAVTLTLAIRRDAVQIANAPIQLPASMTATLQLPVEDTGLTLGSHTYEVFVTSTTNGQVNLTTATYLFVQPFEIIVDSSTPTFLSLADTPNSYSGQADKFVTVNPATSALEFAELGAADIPALDASKIATGQLALARGGTNADLSASGGANQFLKQSGAGAAVTVGSITDADVPNTITVNLAAEATALAANPANCSAGSAPSGINASGAPEGCLAYEEDFTNSSGLRLALSDETGTGAAVFNSSPTIDTPRLTGKIRRDGVLVDDDDCTGEQGHSWYDTTDARFEFCNTNGGIPNLLAPAPPSVETKTSNYSLNSTNDVILCDSTSGDILLILVDAVELPRKQYQIKKIAAANRCSVDASGAETIDGDQLIHLYEKFSAITVVSDGTKWHIVEAMLPAAISANQTATLSPSATNFFAVDGISAASATETNALLSLNYIRPVALVCSCIDAPPGGAANYTLTLRNNTTAEDTDWSVNISGTNCSATDSAGSVLAAGAYVYKSVPSGTPAASRFMCRLVHYGR